MHMAFGVDDIDELMLGANIMERRGWKNTSHNSSGGLSRHRISSALYYYVDCPAGGEAEYHADTDYLDDNWVPRAWDFKFGSLLWATRVPTIFQGDDIPWDMKLDPDGASLEEQRQAQPRLNGRLSRKKKVRGRSRANALRASAGFSFAVRGMVPKSFPLMTRSESTRSMDVTVIISLPSAP